MRKEETGFVADKPKIGWFPQLTKNDIRYLRQRAACKGIKGHLFSFFIFFLFPFPFFSSAHVCQAQFGNMVKIYIDR